MARHSIKIGNVEIKGLFALAPMAGVNNLAFRILCRQYGASLVYSPMIDAKDYVMAKDRSRFPAFSEKERPVAVQLIGSSPEYISKATAMLDRHADIISLNFGCPDSDQLAKKAGAFFIKHPEQMHKIVNAAISSTNKPVEAKIRIGWSDQSLNHVKVALLLEDLGISAITVHGRTRKQGYRGKANWTAIRQVKEKVDIPVIANGDIDSVESAKKALAMTKADMAMIGRAAIGNPYIFKQLDYYFEKNIVLNNPAPKQKLMMFNEFLQLYMKNMRRNKLSEIRAHALWFSKGIPKARQLRQKLIAALSVDEILAYFNRHLSAAFYQNTGFFQNKPAKI